jgi:predicted transcriptional regulator
MTEVACALLAAIVDRYDETEGPVTPAAVAEARGRDPEHLAARFERYVDCALLAPADGGYRPTVTARELLALDCDGRVLIVDPDA